MKDIALPDMIAKRHRYNESNDCAVFAIAAATRTCYEMALIALEDAGRKHRGGVTAEQIYNAVKTLNYKPVQMDVIKALRATRYNNGVISSDRLYYDIKSIDVERNLFNYVDGQLNSTDGIEEFISLQKSFGNLICKSLPTTHTIHLYLNNAKSYLLHSDGHISAYVDGKIYDSWQRKSRKHIFMITEIIG